MGSALSECWLPCREALSVGEEDLPKQLRGLLRVRLDDLNRVYGMLRGQEAVPVKLLSQELGLDARVVQTLGRRSFDILVLLVLASRTHFVTKARFLFAMTTEQEVLNYPHFRKLLSSFLRAVSQLGSGTRKMLAASNAILDSLAFCVFRKYEPAMSIEDFVKISTENYVGAFLRRFSHGIPEEVRLEPWPPEALKASKPSRTPIWDDEDIPRRRGYFLAVRSAREQELHQELQEIHRLRQQENLQSTVDLDIREQAIRDELLRDVTDDVARRDYRRRLQKFWHRSRPNSARPGQVVCQGRLWTASSLHVARGGVLPSTIPRPITPSGLQAAVCSMISSTSLPSRSIADRVLQEFRESSEHSSQASQSERCLFRKQDVLAAFELYRKEYWLKQGGGIRSLLKAGLPISVPKDLSEPEKAWRKRQELEMMFQEVSEERSSLFTPAASQELTLRGFLKVVFPLAKRSDLQTMMHWIKRPQTESKVTRQKKLAQPDMGLLRDLIELFDAIDVVRRFAMTGASISRCINYACYPSNVRASLILNSVLEDRPEWLVAGEKAVDSLESRMAALAAALETELYQLAQGDENLVSDMIEVASNPCLYDNDDVVADVTPLGEDLGKVRLVRLYWRFMVGSAIAQQLREEPSILELKNGKLDLTGFMCVLAQDQVSAIFTLSKATLSPAQIRRFAYAFD